jgi:hypothetical protein
MGITYMYLYLSIFHTRQLEHDLCYAGEEDASTKGHYALSENPTWIGPHSPPSQTLVLRPSWFHLI